MQVARELAARRSRVVRDPVMRGEVVNKISARLGVRVADFETLLSLASRFGKVDAEGCARPIAAPSHDVAMLCLLALRDEEARAFLARAKLARSARETLPARTCSRKFSRPIFVRPIRPRSICFMATLSPAEESLVSGWLLQKMPANAARWRESGGMVFGRRFCGANLQIAESRLRLPNLTTGEMMQSAETCS